MAEPDNVTKLLGRADDHARVSAIIGDWDEASTLIVDLAAALRAAHADQKAWEQAAARYAGTADSYRERAYAAEHATAVRDAIIRRLLDWWRPEQDDDGIWVWYLESGMDDTDIGGDEPMTDAERAVLGLLAAGEHSQDEGLGMSAAISEQENET
jgi:hypothetical protein